MREENKDIIITKQPQENRVSSNLKIIKNQSDDDHSDYEPLPQKKQKGYTHSNTKNSQNNLNQQMQIMFLALQAAMQ